MTICSKDLWYSWLHGDTLLLQVTFACSVFLVVARGQYPDFEVITEDFQNAQWGTLELGLPIFLPVKLL